MKAGHGHALFTAECSHSFHFQCIASNVRYGNLVCPVCRAQWKEVPWQGPNLDAAAAERYRNAGERLNLPRRNEDALRNAEEDQRRLDPVLRILDDSIASFRGHRHSYAQEPQTYDDDDALDTNRSETTSQTESSNLDSGKICVSLFPECEVLASRKAMEKFTALVRLKSVGGQGRRAPVDLVTVLDVSGSMSGTKLNLVKRAMAFLISNLSPADRLSIVTFASSAKRLFPLRRMNSEAQRSASRAIDRLITTGGTNIAQGLYKGAKVLEDRRFRNPVSAIMLLSDGQDTYSFNLRSVSIWTPVHTFGFGNDHDAVTLHAISEKTGGTFSFVQDESLVQDAFAQCVGGLLTVVVQELRLMFSSCVEGAELKALHAGSYETYLDRNLGIVMLGDLYAEESRDILLDLRVSDTALAAGRADLVSVKYQYKDPVSALIFDSKDQILFVHVAETPGRDITPNAEVENQRHRLQTAEAISEARTLADRGEIAGAQRVLQGAKNRLQSFEGRLSGALQAEISEIQERMVSYKTYESLGRPFLLSSESSHFQQRATSRGASVQSFSSEYRTPLMEEMLHRSQNLSSTDLHPWTVDRVAKAALLRKSCARAADLH
eukprot:TRINITY_DN2972_c0_g1_i2.p1 TRINITY_DN2972_c0_g1~~TRINITY_DN2972_c0_g1_i2.p1  ORF type:complete len:607 (+),score=2.68 TRINITY_DN2972_c0_g1_i2:999-2819(+)